MIEIRNLTKRYGSFLAVNDISLTVEKGEIFAFLGANGAGKTTTLRMLTGVLKPTSGQIKIANIDMATNPEEAKAVLGFIPDRPYLYNKLTAREYLYFICELHGLVSKQVDTKIDELLKRYALSQWQDSLIESFSHGMKQRLAMCSALVHQPKVLIVDEPMVGLDPHGAKLLKESFRAYANEGMAILLSTHSLNVAEELADRLAIISKGSIISIGNLAELRKQAGGENKRLEEIFLELTWESSQFAE
ncbi:MAG: ABC transporter ATP-binding protein [Proteobacteria bacterium]|nr:ABC transporter ATP-binding protein [Pseudomonadota bacterium]